MTTPFLGGARNAHISLIFPPMINLTQVKRANMNVKWRVRRSEIISEFNANADVIES